MPSAGTGAGGLLATCASTTNKYVQLPGTQEQKGDGLRNLFIYDQKRSSISRCKLAKGLTNMLQRICLSLPKANSWKLNMLALARASRTWQAEVGGSGVHNHHWLYDSLRPTWATGDPVSTGKQTNNNNDKTSEDCERTSLLVWHPVPVSILVTESRSIVPGA